MIHFNKKFNKYDLSGDWGVGFTSNTNREFYFDLEDYEKIKNYCWSEHQGYLEAYETTSKKIVRFHQIVVNCPKGFVRDHINRNKLDNRKNNIRIITHQDNVKNQSIRSDNNSGVIGVCWNKAQQTWKAGLQVNKKWKLHKNYKTKEEAIKARLKAEKEYFGEFAPQKHLFKEYGVN